MNSICYEHDTMNFRRNDEPTSSFTPISHAACPACPRLCISLVLQQMQLPHHPVWAHNHAMQVARFTIVIIIISLSLSSHPHSHSPPYHCQRHPAVVLQCHKCVAPN